MITGDSKAMRDVLGPEPTGLPLVLHSNPDTFIDAIIDLKQAEFPIMPKAIYDLRHQKKDCTRTLWHFGVPDDEGPKIHDR